MMRTLGQCSKHVCKQWLTVIFILVSVFFLPPYPAQAATTPAKVNVSPQELKAIVQTQKLALQAINTGDFSKIAPYLHPGFTLTTVDNQIFNSVKTFEAYWKQQLSGPIKSIKIELDGEPLRTFLTPEIEVAHGKANSVFNFADGNVGKMPMRWTAVLQKLQNKWMIQSLHFSASLLDNPVLAAAQKLSQMTGIIAGIGGLLLGALGMWFLRPKFKGSDQRR